MCPVSEAQQSGSGRCAACFLPSSLLLSCLCINSSSLCNQGYNLEKRLILPELRLLEGLSECFGRAFQQMQPVVLLASPVLAEYFR